MVLLAFLPYLVPFVIALPVCAVIACLLPQKPWPQ